MIERQLSNLVTDREFEELTQLVDTREPNLFGILGLESSEVSWSAFLRWLLDPSESHRIGDTFLRSFLVDVLSKSEDTDGILAIDAYLLKLSDVLVTTEESFDSGLGRGDIVIKSYSDEFLCIIENKVHSTEGWEQTNRYQEAGDILLRREDLKRAVYVYLTPEGRRPISDVFIPYKYPDLLRVLRGLIKRLEDRTPMVTMLVKQFIVNEEGNIRMEETAEDKRIRLLCRSIYGRHKEAVEALANNMPTRRSFFEDLAQAISQILPDLSPTLAKKWVALSPPYWQRHGKSISDIYYSACEESDRLYLSVEYMGNRSGIAFNHSEIRQKAAELLVGQELARAEPESDHCIIRQDLELTIPHHHDQWPEVIGKLCEHFISFFNRFPPTEWEKVPGVR